MSHSSASSVIAERIYHKSSVGFSNLSGQPNIIYTSTYIPSFLQPTAYYKRNLNCVIIVQWVAILFQDLTNP